MSILTNTHYCSNCKKEIHWQCFIGDNSRGMDVYGVTESQNAYKPIVLSTPQAKVLVLCIVCEECGKIDIIKQKSHNTHNSYKYR